MRHHSDLSIDSVGMGSHLHLMAVRLNQLSCGNLIQVPYVGEATMVYALLSGELDIGWASAYQLRAHPRLLGRASCQRQSVPGMGDIPSFAEAGLSDEAMQQPGWVGTAVAAHVPMAIREALSDAIARVMRTTNITQHCRRMGVTPQVNSSPLQFERFYNNQYHRWHSILNGLNLKLS